MSGDGQRYLLFTLSGYRFALDLLQVAEVCEPCPLWPVPAAPPCFPGAMNHHGAIVAVVELATLMGLPRQAAAEKLVVLRQDGAALAFPAERVLAIVPAERAERCAGEGEPCASGRLRLPGGEATLLDAALIVQLATERLDASP